MSDNSPASLPPEKVPGAGGNGPFIAIAVVLLAVMGGLLFWKFKGDDGETVAKAPPVPTASAKQNTAPPALTDSIPPPPDDEPEPEPTASASVKKPTSGGPCSGTCSGTPSSATRGDIQARAASARGCYERALRNNSQLAGKLTVNVRVDPNGTICGASVSNDSVGSSEVSSCVLGMFRGQRVGAPEGGCADVSVPLNFQQKKLRATMTGLPAMHRPKASVFVAGRALSLRAWSFLALFSALALVAGCSVGDGTTASCPDDPAKDDGKCVTLPGEASTQVNGGGEEGETSGEEEAPTDETPTDEAPADESDATLARAYEDVLLGRAGERECFVARGL